MKAIIKRGCRLRPASVLSAADMFEGRKSLFVAICGHALKDGFIYFHDFNRWEHWIWMNQVRPSGAWRSCMRSSGVFCSHILGVCVVGWCFLWIRAGSFWKHQTNPTQLLHHRLAGSPTTSAPIRVCVCVGICAEYLFILCLSNCPTCVCVLMFWLQTIFSFS